MFRKTKEAKFDFISSMTSTLSKVCVKIHRLIILIDVNLDFVSGGTIKPVSDDGGKSEVNGHAEKVNFPF